MKKTALGIGGGCSSNNINSSISNSNNNINSSNINSSNSKNSSGSNNSSRYLKQM